MFTTHMCGLPPSVLVKFSVFSSMSTLREFLKDSDRAPGKQQQVFLLGFGGYGTSFMALVAVTMLYGPLIGVAIALLVFVVASWGVYVAIDDLASFLFYQFAGDVYYAKKLGPPTREFPKECYLAVDRPWITYVLNESTNQ